MFGDFGTGYFGGIPPLGPFIGGPNPDQVRTGPVQRTPPMIGGLLGGLFGGPRGFGSSQSFNPWGSQSAGLFDQYMNRQMRMYPGGFFGFQPPAMPALQAQQQAAAPRQGAGLLPNGYPDWYADSIASGSTHNVGGGL